VWTRLAKSTLRELIADTQEKNRKISPQTEKYINLSNEQKYSKEDHNSSLHTIHGLKIFLVLFVLLINKYTQPINKIDDSDSNLS